MHETVQLTGPELHETFAPAAARSVYQHKDNVRQAFRMRAENGDINLLPTTGSINEAAYVRYDLLRDFPMVDPDDLMPNTFGITTTLEAARATLSDDMQVAFDEVRHGKVVNDAFQAKYAQQPEAWWITTGDKDADSWLDTATLYNAGVVEVSGKPIVVNDFSGKVDMVDFYNHLPEALNAYTSEGVNPAAFLRVINILPEDNPRFAVPPEIRAKQPDVFNAGFASYGGQLALNERAVNKGFNGEHAERENAYASGTGWRTLFVHEMGHMLDFNGGEQRAETLGWRKRHEWYTDDYGNLIASNTVGQGVGRRVTDDYGKQVLILDHNAPEVYDAQPPAPDGTTVGPVSEYGETKGVEDVAEAMVVRLGATGLKNVRLDQKRKAMTDKLLADRRNMQPDETAEITIRELNPSELDVFDFLPKDIHYYEDQTMIVWTSDLVKRANKTT